MLKRLFYPARLSCFFILVICISKLSAQTFSEVSQSAGINHAHFSYISIGGGTAFFDYNNDGWEDIYITGGNEPDRLFRNNKNGTFTDAGLQAGIMRFDSSYTMGVTTGDIDNDGDRDIFVTKYWDSDILNSKPNTLFRNNGNGTFTDISQSAGITELAFSVSASMGDYNLDGWLDIYVANYIDSNGAIRNGLGEVIGFSHTGFDNFLYRNNRDGTFTEVAEQYEVDDNGTGLAATFTDYDNDHDLDIYAVNDFGAWVTPNNLYRNEYPADSFTNVSISSGTNAAMYGMGIAAGDYDEDGDLDYYITNIGYNVLYQNNGNGTFTDVAQTAGVANGFIYILTYTFHTYGWGAAFFDYDNDTRPDLFVSDGYINAATFIQGYEYDEDKLYKNNGDGTFTDVSLTAGIADPAQGRGLAYGDYDNDGDLDMLVVNTNTDQFSSLVNVRLFRNDLSTGNHWLKVKLQGTMSNRDGFGARVELYGSGRKWIREIDGGSSHASQHSSIAHFGLGSYTNVDSLIVIWPGGARQPVYNNVTDRLITVIQNGPYRVFSQAQIDLCSGDSLFAGGAWQTASGIYINTFGIPGVFDSIIETRLTVHPAPSTTLSYSICAGDSVFAAGAYRHESETYYETLSTSFGCDSTVTAVVHAIPLSKDTINISFCEGDSVHLHGAWRHEAGSYFDSLLSADGCDSVITTVVTVNLAFTFTRSITICEGDRVYLNGAWITEGGIYHESLVSAYGCDSIIETILTVVPDIIISADTTIAEGTGIFIGGAWQTMPGTYIDTFAAQGGCDSIVITEVNVISGVDSFSKHRSISVFPNPAHDAFTLSFSTDEGDGAEVSLLSASGKVMRKMIYEKMNSGIHSLNIPCDDFPPGIYILSVKTGSIARFVKLAVM